MHNGLNSKSASHPFVLEVSAFQFKKIAVMWKLLSFPQFFYFLIYLFLRLHFLLFNTNLLLGGDRSQSLHRTSSKGPPAWSCK